MGRRINRAALFSAITALVVVPAAFLAVTQPGASLPFPSSSSRAPRSDSGARDDRLGPVRQVTTGPSPVRSFVRQIDVRVSGLPDGGYVQVTETARVRLSPAFTMNATARRVSLTGGRLAAATRTVIVRGRTLRTYDGRGWRNAALTPERLAALRAGADPRAFTRLVRAAPGAGEAGPDRFGSVRFGARVPQRDVSPLLPENVAAELRRTFRGTEPVDVELWADVRGRPGWIGLETRGSAVRLRGSVAFRAYA